MSAFHIDYVRKIKFAENCLGLHIPLEYEPINHLSVTTQLTNYALRTSNSTPNVQMKGIPCNGLRD